MYNSETDPGLLNSIGEPITYSSPVKLAPHLMYHMLYVSEVRPACAVRRLKPPSSPLPLPDLLLQPPSTDSMSSAFYRHPPPPYSPSDTCFSAVMAMFRHEDNMNADAAPPSSTSLPPSSATRDIPVTLTPSTDTSDLRHLSLAGRITIGRASRSEIKNLQASPTNALFDCPVVSRAHAVIDFHPRREYDQQVTITDLKSMHGTAVNGQRLLSHAPHILRSGDIIKLGDRVVRGPDHHDAIQITFRRQPLPPILGAGTYAVPMDESASDAESTFSEQDDLSSAQTTPEQDKFRFGSQLQPNDLDAAGALHRNNQEHYEPDQVPQVVKDTYAESDSDSLEDGSSSQPAPSQIPLEPLLAPHFLPSHPFPGITRGFSNNADDAIANIFKQPHPNDSVPTPAAPDVVSSSPKGRISISDIVEDSASKEAKAASGSIPPTPETNNTADKAGPTTTTSGSKRKADALSQNDPAIATDTPTSTAPLNTEQQQPLHLPSAAEKEEPQQQESPNVVYIYEPTPPAAKKAKKAHSSSSKQQQQQKKKGRNIGTQVAKYAGLYLAGGISAVAFLASPLAQRALDAL
ncbi:hypothetical protein D0862_00800 [Hortaea werneckii]|uniref:FHA domain-containing protein n=1 Tax=Hortaea werneckii TaxID=91943 RepID=A0A3M7HVS8_HORWE|nr:hypothetical protein D0862_00800 [Hortaea werneckii]